MSITDVKIKTAILVLSVLIMSCTSYSTRQLLKVHLEMSKADVMSVLDEPATVRESLTNRYGQVVEVWEYELYKPNHTQPTPYWMYFHDGTLVKWCEGGSWRIWEERAAEIYEMQFPE